MAIEISTASYLHSHDRIPRGWGRWAFFMGDDDQVGIDPWFVPHSVSYTEAKKLAKAEAKRRGDTYIIVAP